jgi:hypothetical protein
MTFSPYFFFFFDNEISIISHQVLIGRTVEKTFTLINHSLVRTSFRMQSVDHDGYGKLHEPVFVLKPMSGVIQPRQSVTVRVVYTPHSAGTFSGDYFDFITPGGNTQRIGCTGNALGMSCFLFCFCCCCCFVNQFF